MARIASITKAYIRHYRDNGQTTAYVEWIDTKGQKGRTEGKEHGFHMQALLAWAEREGHEIGRETW